MICLLLVVGATGAAAASKSLALGLHPISVPLLCHFLLPSLHTQPLSHPHALFSSHTPQQPHTPPPLTHTHTHLALQQVQAALAEALLVGL